MFTMTRVDSPHRSPDPRRNQLADALHDIKRMPARFGPEAWGFAHPHVHAYVYISYDAAGHFTVELIDMLADDELVVTYSLVTPWMDRISLVAMNTLIDHLISIGV